MAGGAARDADIAMERYASGDAAAFEVLYDAIAPRLFAYVHRHVRDVAATEDLVQQTMLQIHRARGRFIAGAEVLPWAFCIARRLIIDNARHQQRQPRTVDRELSEECAPAGGTRPDEAVEARQLAQRFDAALEKLPSSQREVFELLRRDGLTLRQAAEVLGTTVMAVKLRAHRATNALRDVVGDPLVEPGE